ncbi:hypothetical protein K431DRAFT_269479 [Polychaeton citri CBS 116435]|uniref:RRM domain-containing protein n=1 Tax=Polychaeton citri CBS 116435 TaxID=1314669 RepID=A0A9P4UPP1_9PEZI|nr:hypothetical protein K431DRAFT_269479 [Polychaeton citri CBS 116435]
MSYPQYGGAGYGYPPGYTGPYAQQYQQQYQTPPQIQNPFAPPAGSYTPSNAPQNARNGSYEPIYEQQVAQWQNAYAPADQQVKIGKDAKGKHGVYEAAPTTIAASIEPVTKKNDGEKKTTVKRTGGGQTWQDNTLLEWDPNQFRIMVGNLAGEVTDDSLAKAFEKYGVSKARVIRDKRTTKSKGYGFVSFTDGEQGFQAAKEMVGKYIGSHPVTIKRSKVDVKPVSIKDNKHSKGKYNKINNRPTYNNANTVTAAEKSNNPLRANTGAGIEKKTPKNAGLKLLG